MKKYTKQEWVYTSIGLALGVAVALSLGQSRNDNTPSCSLAEALTKQDLFINATLSQMGSTLLWNLFREGLTPYRGFFLNLKDFRTQPLAV